jgi:nucleotidyltransferase/DNA polymerase involved in DNA repair
MAALPQPFVFLEMAADKGPPAEIAKTIRRRVRGELGLPVSVGVAHTKHLAKIASQVAKPDGLEVRQSVETDCIGSSDGWFRPQPQNDRGRRW